MSPRLLLAVLASTCLLSACGGDDPAPETEVATAAGVESAPAPAGRDWGPCRVDGLRLPISARLFVVDGAAPVADAEPGREVIRRVDIAVPGPVALLLTAPEATAWHIRPGPETQVRAIVALGDQPQRITGQGLGNHRREASSMLGAECASYVMQGGAGPALAESTDQIFGKRHDAIYAMRISSVIIGGSDPTLDQPITE
ncbi:hypothetical protein GCM10011521_00520 [Arenimonas soli]|uniref:DUF2846 domain-containing protein n=1 Tax=Arenimonas soli TaxID=2269504 RepID=A0ABQ1HA95_9GAMM|nr:hypothetical protein [Arenimonas soli]GGA66327.1 hypothetical protein GCM10011521_00520 [Arenimonas soli]